MINVSNVGYSIAGKKILENVSFNLPFGHKAALVGRNGCGKSTLFNLILGKNQLQDGTITVDKNLLVLTVQQDVPGGEQTAVEYLLSSHVRRSRLMAELEEVALNPEADPDRISFIYEELNQIGAFEAEAEACVVLTGLGFSHEEAYSNLSSFSGGYRMRIALAAALFQKPDILLLDEPTNHLDMEGILWLRNFLKNYKNTLLLISHDRDLLNNCIDTVFHLQRGVVTKYAGDYDNFQRMYAQQKARDMSQNEKIAKQREHMQSFINRFRSKASKASQAQSRIKAMEKLPPLLNLIDDPSINIKFPVPDIPPPPLASYEGVRLGYKLSDGSGTKVVLEKISGTIGSEDRIAILGANGQGKSTFVKMLAGKLEPLKGEFYINPKTKIGYFHQHQHEDLNMEQSAYEYIASVVTYRDETKIRAHLGRFGFAQEKSNTLIGNLSGGEKVRLMFCAICAEHPNMLILDEPTNHLDMDMRESLIMAINNFEGAVIIIAHDWHLLKHTADELWVVENKQITNFTGSIDDYCEYLLKNKYKSK